MRYCTRPDQRKGSCYHEFSRGKWDGKTIWRKDSLLLHDDALCAVKGFADAVLAVLPGYDPCGITEVAKNDWRQIGALVSETGGEALSLYREIDVWASEAFKSADCFTILGI